MNQETNNQSAPAEFKPDPATREPPPSVRPPLSGPVRPRWGAWFFLYGCLALLIGLLVVGAFTFWQYRGYYTYINTPEKALQQAITLEIKPGMNFKSIAELLLMERVISDRARFVLLARSKNLTMRVQAGQYTFRPGMTPLEILDMITRGEVTTVRLLVPEGWTIYQIAERVGTLGPWSEEKFIQAAMSGDKSVSPANSLEGYLFPALYELTMSMTEEEIVDLMVRRGLREMTPERLEQARAVGLKNWHQVLTLASLIEKETGKPEERDLISGVFHNRLKRNMLLQSDPTAVYGLRDFKGPITPADLRRESRYNTYLFPGLPPGPIGNPGSAAIEAALNPAETDYLYFVADGKGGHRFARTLREHNRNINEYRRLLREQRRAER